MKCKNCNINEAVKYSQYSSGEFCCKSCSNSFSAKTNREETNKKISAKLKGRKLGNSTLNLICRFCNDSFEVAWKKRNQKCCSKSCSQSYLMINGKASEMGKKSVSAQSESRRSQNEIYFAELCKQKFQEVKCNEPMFNGWDADVIIEDLKLAVLWNGKWHYSQIKEKHSVEQVQNRDRIKQEEIIKAGYEFYVIKDFGKADNQFVTKKFEEMLVYLKLS
jgi:hypothetical protein